MIRPINFTDNNLENSCSIVGKKFIPQSPKKSNLIPLRQKLKTISNSNLMMMLSQCVTNESSKRNQDPPLSAK